MEIAAIIARLRLMLTMMVDDGLESERDGRERETFFDFRRRFFCKEAIDENDLFRNASHRRQYIMRSGHKVPVILGK